MCVKPSDLPSVLTFVPGSKPMIVSTFFGSPANASITSLSCAGVMSSLNLYITTWRRTFSLSAAVAGIKIEEPKNQRTKTKMKRRPILTSFGSSILWFLEFCIVASSKQCFGRVTDFRSFDADEGSEMMIFDPLGREKVADLPAASDERVRDDAAVAFLGQRFRAHDGRSLLAGGDHELIEGGEEFGRLYVVGVGIELLNAPAGVWRIGEPLTSPAAQIDEMAVFDAGVGE